jgi:hypothetical protein
MPYTIEREGSVLTLRVHDPKIENAPNILGDILRWLDEGGVSEIHVSLSPDAREKDWIPHVIAAFTVNMASRGVEVRVLPPDAGDRNAEG